MLAHSTKMALVVFCLSFAAADELPKGDTDHTRTDKAALVPLQAFVGGWKGVGQLRRGSTQGAWTEQADWAWNFADSRASLVFDASKGKHYISGRLLPGEKSGEFELIATRSDGKAQDRFAGRLGDDGQLVLTAADDDHSAGASEAEGADRVARISIRTVADGDRLLVLYERRVGGADRFARIAEVGYTREGISFAKGSGQPECVVTGGLGTIEVKFQGRTYYVCCTGCRDMFDENPEGVLADYRERKRQEKEKAKGTSKEKVK
ncbi:MAG TPA: hypothetical protein VGX76_23860 [Pirellulales bacterium]|nr:hypothetical protein [Pirellulales bacterium]